MGLEVIDLKLGTCSTEPRIVSKDIKILHSPCGHKMGAGDMQFA